MLCFIVLGLAMLVGIIHSDAPVGLRNWTVGEAPFVGNVATWVGWPWWWPIRSRAPNW